MKIGRIYRFEAAHFLPLVPDGHKCKNMHGHNYKVEVTVDGSLASLANGFVMDFADLDSIVLPIIKTLDHTVLNNVAGLENPTAEIIALWLKHRLPLCKSVSVFENEDCWAEVGP